MKTVQLQAARLARGRSVDLATPFAALAERWASAVGRVEEWHRQA